MPNSEHFEVLSTYHSLTNKLKHHRHLLNQFINQWWRDYLLSLRESHTLKAKRGGHDSIQEGDVVVLKSDTCKRVFWKLAIVMELLKGSDGQAQAAVVKVIDPQGCTQLLRRSVKHLYPIEVNTNDVSDVSDVSQLVDQGLEGTSSVSPSMRTLSKSSSSYSTRTPRHQAAIAGEEIRRNNYYK